MYIYGNNCGVNNECGFGYSLYFPCIKTITRGENACFDFYIVDNSTKEEVKGWKGGMSPEPSGV